MPAADGPDPPNNERRVLATLLGALRLGTLAMLAVGRTTPEGSTDGAFRASLGASGTRTLIADDASFLRNNQ